MNTERTEENTHTALTPSAVEFIEGFARLMEQDGGSRTAGRMVALLLLSAAERSIDELAEQLQASKASISTNARTLEQWGVLERTTHPGDRRDYYRIKDNGVVTMLERRLEWLRRVRDVAGEGAQTPEADHPLVSCRFGRLCQMHELLVRETERMIRRLRTAPDDLR
jgi:DNA-binding MarR family transcriptional regulator